MSKGIRYTDEFEQEAVNQIVVHGYSVLDVCLRLGVSAKSLCDWQKKFSKPRAMREANQDLLWRRTSLSVSSRWQNRMNGGLAILRIFIRKKVFCSWRS